MSFAPSSSFIKGNVPLHFYQVRGDGETTNNIAAKFDVDVKKILKDNPGIEAFSGGIIPVGEMIVLSFKV